MSIRKLSSNKYDPRYSQSIEYRPVDVYNDSGQSEIPASADHTHALFDNGISLAPNLTGAWQMYDSLNPCKLYRAGNHIIIDGQLKRSGTIAAGEVIFTFDPANDIQRFWTPGFNLKSGCAIGENPIGTYDNCDLSVISGGTTVTVSDAGIVGGFVRFTINAFYYRTDSLSTAELKMPGEWLTYQPTVDQGATQNIARNITMARYYMVDRIVVCEWRADMTGPGTAGADILIDLPIAPFNPGGANFTPIGIFDYYDASVNQHYVGIPHIIVANSQVIGIIHGGSTGIGTNPNFAVASGDVFLGGITYEAAA